ncbi:MAG: His/Gly/Thr/Pro-type tRNA ligase C-terminal domain-containing protein [Patescibacteria group bacterium]
MGAFFTDQDGSRKPMIMGCYGIGIGRILGTVVEMHGDSRGIVWPNELSPFAVHILALASSGRVMNKRIFSQTAKLYKDLKSKGVNVLYDDRIGVSAGQKFADADLVGARWRVVVSEKTLVVKKVEIKKRSGGSAKLVSVSDIFKIVNGK